MIYPQEKSNIGHSFATIGLSAKLNKIEKK
jgi:hypothetical protein